MEFWTHLLNMHNMIKKNILKSDWLCQTNESWPRTMVKSQLKKTFLQINLHELPCTRQTWNSGVKGLLDKVTVAPDCSLMCWMFFPPRPIRRPHSSEGKLNSKRTTSPADKWTKVSPTLPPRPLSLEAWWTEQGLIQVAVNNKLFFFHAYGMVLDTYFGYILMSEEEREKDRQRLPDWTLLHMDKG